MLQVAWLSVSRDRRSALLARLHGARFRMPSRALSSAVSRPVVELSCARPERSPGARFYGRFEASRLVPSALSMRLPRTLSDRSACASGAWRGRGSSRENACTARVSSRRFHFVARAPSSRCSRAWISEPALRDSSTLLRIHGARLVAPSSRLRAARCARTPGLFSTVRARPYEDEEDISLLFNHQTARTLQPSESDIHPVQA